MVGICGSRFVCRIYRVINGKLPIDKGCISQSGKEPSLRMSYGSRGNPSLILSYGFRREFKKRVAVIFWAEKRDGFIKHFQ